MLDLLLTGGEVHDGAGGDPVRADVGIRDGRFVNLAEGAHEPARRTLDVTGLAVAPGFIDPHSHADLVLMLEETAAAALLAPRLRQGITTVLVGNCGMGAAPVGPATEPLLRALNGWMTPAEVPWPWTDLGSYLDMLERRRLPLHVGALQPHGPLRLEACGAGPGALPPEAAARMRRRVREAMEAGAFGLSAGLIYPPGLYAATAELIDLAREAARVDGVFACHLRGSSELLLPATDELLEVGRAAGCRVHHSHSEAVGREHWWKIDAVLEREERARRSGLRVGHDLFPYHAAATTMAALFPPRALVGGIEALLARLRSAPERPALRRAIEETSPAWPPWTPDGWPHNLVRAVGWESIRIASLPPQASDAEVAEAVGRDLARFAAGRGAHPFDALADLMVAHGGEVGQLLFGITGEEGNDEPMRRLLADPHGAICTDAEDLGRGLPHPAAHGAFPRVLGYWVRERRALSLAEAIRRMTSLPAEQFGIAARGRIVPGFHADCVVLDPGEVADRATYAAPRTSPAGIRHVLVGGSLAIEDGRPAGGSSGRVLRRGARP